MKNYRKASLAGIAALTFVAGTGLAAAQMSNSGPQIGQSPGTSAGSHGGARPMSKSQDRVGMSAHTPSGNQHGASTQTRGQAQTGMHRRNAQNLNPANRTNQTNRAAKGNRLNERRNTAQGQRTLRGPRGAAQQAAGQPVQASGGTNVRLSDEQRTRIRQTIIEANNAPRVGHVNFGVNVGTAIPRHALTTIRVLPVPLYLAQIEPRWRGYEYFVYADRMVIVNPHDLRIVAIIQA